jgi:tRNA threonylcarbamoyladenosine biosynthesis protein TsaE
LVRGFLHALGYSGHVKSPTYTIVEPYQINEHKIYHFDFYRLLEPEELEYMGIRDYLQENALCLIEWPERGGLWTPQANIEIQLFHHGVERSLRIKSHDDIDLSSLTEIQ